MKVRVISIFRDKYTKKIHKINDELDVSKKRYEEIKQYVEKIKKARTEEGGV
jgi:prefoldin subunit 5